MVLLDRAGRVETCNHAAEARSNASRDSLKGADFAERMLDPADRDRAAALFRELAPGTAAEIESALPGSPDAPMLRWTFVAFEEPARPGSLLAVAETMPARPPSGGENDTIAHLARGLARRLNQHLTAVLGYGELLSDREHGGLAVPEGLAEIRRAAHRIAALAGSLQEYAGSCRVRPEPVDLDRLVREYVELARPRLREGSTLTTRLDADGAPALADRLWLERALATLGGFVREMTPAGGRLEFRTSATDGADSPSMLLLEIRGADAVLSAETAACLFEPFQPQGNESLMFPALRNAISRCGGSLDAEASPGGGLAFRIRLPAAPRRPPA
jgi:signal transduction histidine kinase